MYFKVCFCPILNFLLYFLKLLRNQIMVIPCSICVISSHLSRSIWVLKDISHFVVLLVFVSASFYFLLFHLLSLNSANVDLVFLCLTCFSESSFYVKILP